MGDREANERATVESLCLMHGEESTVEEREMQNVTTADSSDETVTGTEGNTDLHKSLLSVCQETDTNVFSSTDHGMLMLRQEAKLNLPNAQGYTKIGCAVNQLDKTRVESMLMDPSAKGLYLDYYPGDSENTVRESIMQTYSDLQPLLPPPLMKSLDSSDRNKILLAAIQDDKYDIFIKNVNQKIPNPWYDEPYHSSLLEIACQMKNRKRFVEYLLVVGANPNTKNRVTGMPLIHATARSGNLELLEMLLMENRIDVNVKDNEHRTILHWWARVSEKNPNDKEKLGSCFSLLLDKGFLKNGSIEDQDSSGNTPFSIAVAREYRDRIIMMLDTDNDETESTHIDHILESASKSLLESILDYCFDSNNEPAKSENLEVKLKSHALFNMMYFVVNSSHKDLLKHPVMSVYLNLLWKKLKFIFFLNVALYITFVISLTAYILFSEFCNMQNNRGVAINSNSLLSHNDSNLTCDMIDERRYNISQFLWYTLMILLGLIFVREVFQLSLYRMNYIKSKENWLEILLIIVTFTSCSGIVDSIEVKRHLFVYAIVLGWFELVLLLGGLPLFSVQTEMFKKVSLTFLRYMMRYIVLILAFAFSFYIIFKENRKGEDVVLFTNPFISILRTTVMFSGEFNASDLPFDTLPYTSHVIFWLFVFFVAIVLLNLMNGLAVGDTKKVREDAETVSLQARVRLITYIFDVYFALPFFMTHYLILADEEYVLFPNKKKNISSTDLRSLLSNITEKRERNKKEKMNEHVENWKLFAEKLSTLQSESKEMQKMLKRILTHLDIPET